MKFFNNEKICEPDLLKVEPHELSIKLEDFSKLCYEAEQTLNNINAKLKEVNYQDESLIEKLKSYKEQIANIYEVLEKRYYKKEQFISDYHGPGEFKNYKGEYKVGAGIDDDEMTSTSSAVVYLDMVKRDYEKAYNKAQQAGQKHQSLKM